MPSKKNIIFITLSLLALFFMVSCSDDDDDSGNNANGVSSGRITGFGSVIVNGTKFNTATATILEGDEVISEADLAIGKNVTVVGTINDDGTGVAQSITFEAEIKGIIDAIDANAGTMQVLGQDVLVDAKTVFEGADFAALVVNNVVEVSGFIDAAGTIRATFVEKEADAFTAGDRLEVKGFVSNLNEALSLFDINALTIDFSGAQLEGFDNGLADGLFVRVRTTQDLVGGQLIAEEVQQKDLEIAEPGNEVEIEGFVTAVNGADEFTLNNQVVKILDSTVFEDGDINSIIVGAELEVEGTIDNTGALVAEEISVELDDNIEIESTVEALIAGEEAVTILGINVLTSENTIFKDNSDTKEENFSFANINVGDFLEIDAFLDGTGNVVASKVERQNFDPKVSLQGPLAALANPNLTILGVTIETNGATTFEDIDGNLITAATFFGTTALETIVKGEGTLVGGNIVADEVEIEELP